MTHSNSRIGLTVPLFAAALLVLTFGALVACEPVRETPLPPMSLGRAGFVAGEVRTVRATALPDDVTVTVRLLDVSWADAPATELGQDVIENADRLPVRFRIQYERNRVSGGNEYSLSAEVRQGDNLLYINDTVHPVLTRGAPRNSDVFVVSTNPRDTCVAPLPGEIHAETTGEDLPRGAVLQVRLIEVGDAGGRLVVTETSITEPGRFPIMFELPFEGVRISRHARYELEAEIVVGDATLYHVPNEEWRRIWLPHCPNEDVQLVTSVFSVSEFPKE